MATYHGLHVAAVIDETADAKSFVFDVPPELAETFRYRPGQFLTLRLPVQGRHLPRCYSMSSAPALDAAPRITVKRVPGGRGSNWLCDHVRAGDRLDVMAPAGLFTPRDLDQDFLLLAGGSGITPVFAIARSALRAGYGRIVLVYANRDERSVIFAEALAALAAEYVDRLQVIHWLDSVQGVPRTGQIAGLVRPFHAARAFICGPSAFMEAALAAALDAGIDEDCIHVERFASLPDEEAVAWEVATPAAIDVAEVEIVFDGQSHRILCEGDQTLLDAALKAGLPLPHSCQAGICASCMCQVQAGDVHLRHNEVLDEKDLAKSWTLACQAVPTSRHVRVKFPE